jgi:hypothetical protein
MDIYPSPLLEGSIFIALMHERYHNWQINASLPVDTPPCMTYNRFAKWRLDVKKESKILLQTSYER